MYGLYAEGQAASFESHRPILDEMAKSLTLERPELYPEERNDTYGFSIRVPASWRPTHGLSGRDQLLMQFTSPAVGADRNRQTVHASLTLTVEPIAGGGDVEAYYGATRQKMGESFAILSHTGWRGGYVDVMRTETPVAVSRVKRFYRATPGRGYCLAFEARDDVFSRVSKWCDLIAATLKVGPELTPKK